MTKWTIDKLETPEMFRVQLGGDFDVVELRQMLDELSRQKEDFPFVPILVDNRGFDLSTVSDLDLLTISNIFLFHNSSLAHSKIALLMDAGNDALLATEFENLSRAASDSVFSVFTDEPTALEWLAIQ